MLRDCNWFRIDTVIFRIAFSVAVCGAMVRCGVIHCVVNAYISMLMFFGVVHSVSCNFFFYFAEREWEMLKPTYLSYTHNSRMVSAGCRRCHHHRCHHHHHGRMNLEREKILTLCTLHAYKFLFKLSVLIHFFHRMQYICIQVSVYIAHPLLSSWLSVYSLNSA